MATGAGAGCSGQTAGTATDDDTANPAGPGGAGGAAGVSPVQNVDRDADQAAAEAALLTLADFPAGWTVVEESNAVGSVDNRDGVYEEVATCLGIDFPYAQRPKAHSQNFQSPELAQTSAEVTFTPTPADAGDVLEMLRMEGTPQCYAQAAEVAMNASLVEDGYHASGTLFEEEPVTSLGDDAFGFRISSDVAGPRTASEMSMHFLVVQVGRVGITTNFASPDGTFDFDEALRLTQLVIDRVPAE
jgi:hypothetical protein